MSVKAITEYHYNSTEMLADPDQVFDRLRAEGEVVWSPKMRRWLILSEAAAKAALRDRSLRVYDVFKAFDHIASLSGNPLDELATVTSWIPFLADDQRHKQLRLLFAKVLNDILEPYLKAYEDASSEMIAAVKSVGTGDFATGYADRVHVEAFGRICGISAEDRLAFASLASSDGAVDFAVRVVTLVEANDRAKALLSQMVKILERAEDTALIRLIGKRLREAGIEDTLQSRAEFLVALTLLGRDTLAGSLTVWLAEMFDAENGRLQPGAWPETSAMLDEVLRVSSAVQIVNRVALKPVTIGGQKIEEGEILMIFLPAANRDPRSFECPHRFSVAHAPGLPFGVGAHACVGKQMTYKALQITLRHLSTLSEITARPGRQLADGRNTRKYAKLPITVR